MRSKEEIDAYATTYRKEHAEKLRLYAQNYYKENKTKISEKNRIRHVENREKDNEIKRAWYKRNRPRILEEKCKYNYMNRIARHEYNESHRRRVWATRTRAMHRTNGFVVNLALDDLHDMAENIEKCPICECELKWLSGHGKTIPNSPTLDRIDNQNEMNIENVWIICHRCNTMKRDLPMKEYIEHCKMVVSKFGNMDASKEVGV